MLIGDRDISLSEFKEKITDYIDHFISEKIVNAQEPMVRNGVGLFSKTKQETIMVVGANIIFDLVFKRALEEGR